MRLYIGIWVNEYHPSHQPSGVEFCIGLDSFILFHSELLLFQNIWGSRPRVCNHMSTSFQEHSPRICRLWCGNPEMHSSLHFSHGASGCCWEMSDVSTCAPRLQPSLPFLQLLLRSHSQCSSASLLSAFPEQLLVSRPSVQVSPLCLSYPAEQATGTPRGFSDPAANTTPPSSSDHRPLVWKEGSGHCLAGTLVKVNLPQGFNHRGLFVWAYLLFAFRRQSGCNFSSRHSVWLLFPSLLILPFSPVAALQAVSVWVIPSKPYTQTHICTLELTPTHRHIDQGKNSSELPIWISWPQDLSLIVMLCSDSHDLYHFPFSFQLLFCSTFHISQGSFIQVYVFWFVSASLCNPPLLKSQGKKNNTQEQNMWLINQILGKTQILQWNRTKCKELSPWEESQAAQGWRLWVIGLFPLAGSLWIV